MNKSASVGLLTAIALQWMVPAVAADDDGAIPEVIVTADKFEKSIQDTPIAVTVVSGDEISQLGRTKIDDVLVNQPAVVVQGAARGFLVSIRGLGLSLPPQMGQGAVSTNYDGAFSSRAENASAGFYDLDRVEILRGPQSTLYGRNSVGGVVNIISRNPSLDGVSGYVSAEAGDYSLFHGEGAVNIPLGATTALRIAAASVNRDGYMSNGHDDNVAHAGRAKLLFQPNDAMRLIVGVEYSGLRGKGPGAVPIASVLAGNRTTTDVGFGKQRANAWKYSADFSLDAGPGTLRVLPSYQETRGETLGAFGGNFNWAADPKLTKQKALELRYSSRRDSTYEWNLGFYHYDSNGTMQTISGACQDVLGNYVVPPPGFNSVPPGPPGPAGPNQCLSVANAVPTTYLPEIRTSKTDGLFGQVTIPAGDRFRLIAGVRESWEKTSGSNDSNAGFLGHLSEIKDSHFDYRLGVEADLGESSLAYLTSASGYRQGGFGFSTGFGPAYQENPYKPEKMRSYEAGLKNRLMGGRMLLNATVFYYDYKAFQLVIADFSNFPPAFSVPTMPGRSFGVELESAISVGRLGKFNASLVRLDTKLDGLNGFYVGVPFPNSPKWQLKAGFEQGINLPTGILSARADLRVVSSQVVFPETTIVPTTHPSVQDKYSTGDLSIAYRPHNDRYSITAYLKNVNDEFIKQSHFFGYSQLAAPRTFGVSGMVKF